MADRSDQNKKEFSIEELNAWNVEKLRKYLKNRGVVIITDTRKRDLVSKVYHACRLDLPLCSTATIISHFSLLESRCLFHWILFGII